METRQQLLGTWLYSSESFAALFFVGIPSGVSSDRVGVMGSDRRLVPCVASVLVVIRISVCTSFSPASGHFELQCQW